MTKEQIDEIALRVAKDRYVAQHSGTGEGINFANYAEFTHALLAELANVQGPVAFVDDAGVIIVCSHSYKPGDKLFTHPAPSVPEGYQLVPIEPTKAMMWALYGHWVGQLTHLDYGYYKAMLSAARSE